MMNARKKIVRMVRSLGASAAFDALSGSVLAEIAGLGDVVALADFINLYR